MASHSPPAASLREQLLHESLAMAQHALASGMHVPPAAATTLEQARAASGGTDVAALVKVHDQLSKLVAPATPRALLLMGPDHGGGVSGWKSMLGSVPLVRRLMAAALVSILLYVVVGLSEDVGTKVRTVQGSYGIPLLLNEVAWLAAAAMGASFALLMQVSGYVVKRNYDPRYEASYWIRFFLGVMAGFILVQIVPLAEATGSDPQLSQLMIALLGGFSASAVFRILNRLVEAVESLVRGDAKAEIARRENEARSRASEETSQVRMGLAAQVVRLQREVSIGADPAALTARLQEILGGLVPDSMPEPEPPAPPEGTIALPGINVVGESAEPAEPAPATPTAG